MKKNFSLIILCLLAPFSFLLSESYLELGLENIKSKSVESLVLKAKAVYKMEKILVSLLQLNMDPEVYYTSLRDQQVEIESIFAFTQELYDVKYPIQIRDKRLIKHNGKELWVYYNNCTKSSDDGDYFQNELKSFNENSMVNVEILDKHSLNELSSGLSYNFILTPDQEVYVSPNTIGVKKNEHKVHFTANHALLSNNQPVVTAGELVIYKHRGKYLCFIANSTGHYKTETSSLVYMTDFLVQLGIPKEAIFEISVPVRKLNSLCIDLLKSEKQESEVSEISS